MSPPASRSCGCGPPSPRGEIVGGVPPVSLYLPPGRMVCTPQSFSRGCFFFWVGPNIFFPRVKEEFFPASSLVEKFPRGFLELFFKGLFRLFSAFPLANSPCVFHRFHPPSKFPRIFNLEKFNAFSNFYGFHTSSYRPPFFLGPS